MDRCSPSLWWFLVIGYGPATDHLWIRLYFETFQGWLCHKKQLDISGELGGKDPKGELNDQYIDRVAVHIGKEPIKIYDEVGLRLFRKGNIHFHIGKSNMRQLKTSPYFKNCHLANGVPILTLTCKNWWQITVWLKVWLGKVALLKFTHWMKSKILRKGSNCPNPRKWYSDFKD